MKKTLLFHCCIISLLYVVCWLLAVQPVRAVETTVYLGGMEKTIETGEVKVYVPAGSGTVLIDQKPKTKDPASTAKRGEQNLDQRQLTYIYTDHLGSTVLTTDELGNKKETNLYYPYGKITNFQLPRLQLPPATADDGQAITNQNPNSNPPAGGQTDKLYTGQQIDSSSDLYFYNARYYNPQIGNFISADKAEGPNRYSYVGNNPVMRNDPSGNYDSDVGAERIRREFLMQYAYKYGIFIDEEGRTIWTDEELNKADKILTILPEKLLIGKKLILTDRIIGGNRDYIAEYKDGAVYLNESMVFIRKAGDYKETLLHELMHGLVDTDKYKISERKEDIDSIFFNQNGEVDWNKFDKWTNSLEHSEDLRKFTVLSGWVYDANKDTWKLTKQPSIWDKLKEDSPMNRYNNPNEDFVCHGVEYFFDSSKYRKKYGEDLANFFQKIFYGE